MTDLRKKAVVLMSCVAVLAAIIGVYQAIHSPLFTVQVVEITDQVSTTQASPWIPVDPQAITDLAAVPVGLTNLFDLDLKGVEKRILENDWIREVRLQKRFPQTLSITAIFREPVAIAQFVNGDLAYVDEEGRTFGKVSLAAAKDLPLISALPSGASGESAEQLKSLLKIMSDWKSQRASKFARIESISHDAEKGYRMLISYSLGHHLIHARVDLGTEFSFSHLGQVLEYLQAHSIAARQVWADAGKKIVVKTARGS